MKARDIFEATSYADAAKVFARITGIANPKTLTPDQLKTAYRNAMKKLHPDAGGTKEMSQAFNDAYDVLKAGDSGGGGASGFTYDRDSDGATRPRGGPREPTPQWAYAGYSGGSPPNASIHHNDYRDMNYFKKKMWELSGESKEEWHIQGFDGFFFRHGLTVYGSPQIFDEMAKAMIIWQTKGGNPYDVRAVIVSRRRSDDLKIIYADGKFYGRAPIDIPVDDWYDDELHAQKDQQIARKLPAFLDAIGRHPTDISV